MADHGRTRIRQLLLAAARRTVPDTDGATARLWDDITAVASEELKRSQSTRALGQNLAGATAAVSALLDAQRFRLWAEMLVSFDLHEAVGGLLLIVQSDENQMDALFAAASVVGSPSVDPELRSTVRAAASGLPLNEYERVLLSVLLDPAAAVPMDLKGAGDLRRLAAARWPGTSPERASSVPIVVYLSDAFPAPNEMAVLGDVVAAGGLLRRGAGRDLESEPFDAALAGPKVLHLTIDDIPDTAGDGDPPLWPERLAFMAGLQMRAADFGLSFNLRRFIALRSATDEQRQAATAVLHLDSKQPAVSASQAREYWAGGVEKMFREQRAQARASEDLRNTIAEQVARIIEESARRSEPLRVHDAIALGRALVQKAHPNSDPADVNSVISAVLGLIKPQLLQYVDDDSLLVDEPH